MANTYSQCYFHLVFAVKYRMALISRDWNDDLEQYITTIVQKHGHKLIAIGSMPDHIHIFIGYKLTNTIPELVEEIKTSSTHWINRNGFSKYKFQWQKGYGAFTHSHSNVSVVANYVINQEEIHRRRSFRNEYINLLKENEIEYSDKYNFDFFTDQNE